LVFFGISRQTEDFYPAVVQPAARAAFSFANGGGLGALENGLMGRIGSNGSNEHFARWGRGRGRGNGGRSGRGLYNLQFIQRDFTSDDYEMLLSLDDNKGNTKGATKEQIKSIKSHKVKSDTKLKNEQCSICLDDIIGKQTNTTHTKYKQLSCSHAYHPQCIDRWLAESRTCPICSAEVIFKEKTEKKSSKV